MSPVLLLLLPRAVLAGTVVDYSENFDSYTAAPFSGTGGWVSTIPTVDGWSAVTGGGVYATTDNPGGTWGSGSYADNHLRYTSETWSDFTFDVVANSNDDDAIGVVFRYTNATNFYIAFWTRGAYPSTGTGAGATATAGTALLYKVVAGTATQLDSYATSYTSSVDYNLRVVTAGSSIAVWFDLDRDSVWDTGEDLLTATDTAHTTGQIGLYCYDNGSTTGCIFDNVVVRLEDTDGDGIADVSDSDVDGDGYTASADCNDLVSAIKPGATETCDGVDTDCDGKIDDGTTCYDDDGDGYTELSGDCNDASSAIEPGAVETCDGVDEDCDGSIDDSPTDGTTWYADGDSDGYGASSAGVSCAAPSGAVSTSGDCADADATAHPGASETCDGVDDDCDGSTDESATDATAWYDDVDGDGYGDAGRSTTRCTAPSGAVSSSTDCEDGDDTIHPGAAEVCDGVDQDCDGTADEGATDLVTWYLDGDGDGFGGSTSTVTACSPPSAAYSSGSTDCDDLLASIYPGAAEVCDGEDQDCDGSVDESARDALTWFLDDDLDGYGDPNVFVDACDAPFGYIAEEGDCDDASEMVNPAAVEIEGNGIDEDCDGLDGPADTDPGDTDTGDSDPGDTDTGDSDPLDTDTGEDTDAKDTDTDEPGTSSRAWARGETGLGGPSGAGCGCASRGAGVPAALAWVTMLAIVTRRSRRERK